MADDIIQLELAEHLAFSVHRIGYADEGIRLTFFAGYPYDMHFEVQLSANDTEQLIKLLTKKLKEELKRGNLPFTESWKQQHDKQCNVKSASTKKQ